MNPPYGKDIDKWIAKALEAADNGATVVCLIFARTDTKYWHKYIMKAKEIRFIKGRLTFVGAASSAPAPSVIIVFKKHNQTAPTISSYER